MIFCRPLNARAQRSVINVASLPELVKRSCSTDGTRERMISASATWLRVGAAYADPRCICSVTALTTAGFAWPSISDVKLFMKSMIS